MTKEEKILEQAKHVIENSLYGPGGDPEDSNLLAARHALEIFHILDRKDLIDNDWIETLSGANVYETNFIDDLGYPNQSEE